MMMYSIIAKNKKEGALKLRGTESLIKAILICISMTWQFRKKTGTEISFFID